MLDVVRREELMSVPVGYYEYEFSHNLDRTFPYRIYYVRADGRMSFFDFDGVRRQDEGWVSSVFGSGQITKWKERGAVRRIRPELAAAYLEKHGIERCPHDRSHR